MIPKCWQSAHAPVAHTSALPAHYMVCGVIFRVCDGSSTSKVQMNSASYVKRLQAGIKAIYGICCQALRGAPGPPHMIPSFGTSASPGQKHRPTPAIVKLSCHRCSALPCLCQIEQLVEGPWPKWRPERNADLGWDMGYSILHALLIAHMEFCEGLSFSRLACLQGHGACSAFTPGLLVYAASCVA